MVSARRRRRLHQVCLSFCSVPVDVALSPTSWWSRKVLSSRSTHRRVSAQVTAGRWCILCWVCGWWQTVLVSSSSVIVVWGCQFWSSMACPGTMLPWSGSFNGNGFASGKLLSRFVKLLISDGAALSSGEEVICFLFLWWPLWWCRRKETGAGILHRIILSFQSCNVGAYVPCNRIFILYK